MKILKYAIDMNVSLPLATIKNKFQEELVWIIN
jgi:hypothetical protein